MKKKADVSVIINNKEYIICGYESAEYIEKIASYINKKQHALKCEEGYNTLERDLKSVLLDINIADDYFKAKSQIAELEAERSKTREELFEVKHEAVIKTTKLKQLQESKEALEQELQEAKRTIVELKARLEQVKQ